METRTASNIKRQARRARYGASTRAKNAHAINVKIARQNKTKTMNAMDVFVALLQKRCIMLELELQRSQSTIKVQKQRIDLLENKSLPHPTLQQFKINVFRSSDRCQRCLGMTKSDFENLFLECSPQFALVDQSGKPLLNPHTSSSTISDEDQLFIALVWMRHYLVMKFLEAVVDIHERTLGHIIHRILFVLNQTLQGLISWPSDSELEGEKDNIVDPNCPWT